LLQYREKLEEIYIRTMNIRAGRKNICGCFHRMIRISA
jgi:hypothetical protein